MNYNAILCAPTLLCEKRKDISSNVLGLNISAIYGLLCNKEQEETKGIVGSQIANPLEFYVRTMLSACAHTISIPAYGRSMWATPRQVKSLMSESSHKRLKFVDRSHAIWNAAEKYVTPIFFDLLKGVTKEDFGRNCRGPFDDITWGLYLLLLAVRGHSEVSLNPIGVMHSIDTLGQKSCLAAESRARLAILRGLFGLFKKPADVPGFRCVLGKGQLLKERLDEIIDDAYLLDASRLRRFFGVQSNAQSITKDLRKLIRFIAKNRSWAKGAILATSQSAMLPSSSAEVMDKAFEILPDQSPDSAAPVLVDPDSLFAGLGKVFVLTSQRRPFEWSENWSVQCRLSGH